MIPTWAWWALGVIAVVAVVAIGAGVLLAWVHAMERL